MEQTKQDLDAQIEEHQSSLRSAQNKKSQRLYDQLRRLHQDGYYTENAFERACASTIATSTTAIYVCLRYLMTYTVPALDYHVEVGSYRLFVMVDKWAQETCKQKHTLSEGAVIEACRLLEIPLCTDTRNPQHMQIAFRFVWEEGAGKVA